MGKHEIGQVYWIGVPRRDPEAGGPWQGRLTGEAGTATYWVDPIDPKVLEVFGEGHLVGREHLHEDREAAILEWHETADWEIDWIEKKIVRLNEDLAELKALKETVR